MKLCRCACGCSAAPLLRSRSAPFRAELRAVRTFAAGGACFGPFGALRPGRQPDRLGRWSAEPNSVRTAAKRQNTLRNAAFRPGAGWEPVRRSAMRENSHPLLSRKRTVSINRAQSRTGVRALPRRERRPWENERSLLVASHRRPRLRMRVAPKGICRTVPPRSRKGAGRPRRRGLDWDLRSCSGTENGPGCECGEKGGNL